MTFYIASDAVYSKGLKNIPLGEKILGSEFQGKSPSELQAALAVGNYNATHVDHGLADERGKIIVAPCVPDLYTEPSLCRLAASTGRGILSWIDTFSSNPGVLGWGPIESKNQLLGIPAYKAIIKGNSHLFFSPSVMVVCSIDVDRMSKFLQESILSLPTGSRLYLIQRDSWLQTEDSIIATSHGKSWISTIDVNGLTSRLPANASTVEDHLIKEHSTFMVQRSIETGFEKSFYNLTYNGSTSAPDWISNNGTTYWVQLQLITDETIGSKSELRLYAIVLVPRDVAMATITKATQQVRSTIEEEEKKTDENLQTSNFVTIGVLAASICLIVVVTAVFFTQITAPLQSLAHDMHEVASMNLENLNEVRELSSLSELRRMQTSFATMANAILEYRNYLPQSMLDQIQTSDDESVYSEGNTPTRGNVDSNSFNSGQPSTLTINLSNASLTMGMGISSSFKAGLNSGHHQCLKDSSLKKKKCTLAYINVVDFHGFLENTETETCITETHATIVGTIMRIVGNNGGTPDIFNGDRILCAFNAIRPCGAHSIAASKTVITIRDTLLAENQGLRISSGLVYGSVMTGNMGCQGMKKYSYIGKCVSLVYILERLARWNNVSILANGYLVKDANSKMAFRAMFPLNFEKISSSPTTIFELTEERKISEEEWMYALAEGERNDKWIYWNTAVKEIFNPTPDWPLLTDKLEQLMSLSQIKEVTKVIDAINCREPLVIENFRYT